MERSSSTWCGIARKMCSSWKQEIHDGSSISSLENTLTSSNWCHAISLPKTEPKSFHISWKKAAFTVKMLQHDGSAAKAFFSFHSSACFQDLIFGMVNYWRRVELLEFWYILGNAKWVSETRFSGALQQCIFNIRNNFVWRAYEVYCFSFFLYYPLLISSFSVLKNDYGSLIWLVHRHSISYSSIVELRNLKIE